MKIVALSDTHGDLSHINRITAEHRADAVIHMGDFGFFTHERTSFLPKKEQILNIKHNSKIPWEIRKRAWDMDEDERLKLIEEYQALGDFDKYISGEKKFDVPVYAIPGNHEDNKVVKDLVNQDLIINNLNLVTPDCDFVLESRRKNIRLLGIGGNFLLKQFFRTPDFTRFYPAMTFDDWVRLRERMKNVEEHVWMMTHVSPGKEPLLEMFAMHLKPKIWFSGHMGAPNPQHYSLFTFNEDQDMLSRTADTRKYAQMLLKQYLLDLETWFEFLDYMVDYHYQFDIKFDVVEDYITSSGKNLSRKMISAAGSITSRLHEKIDKEEFYSVATHSTTFPSYLRYKQMVQAQEMFDLPFKERERNENLRAYLKRNQSDAVKGTWFFNLPDVYTDAYVVIDTEGLDNRYEIQSYGRL